jgi:hypothetical protein
MAEPMELLLVSGCKPNGVAVVGMAYGIVGNNGMGSRAALSTNELSERGVEVEAQLVQDRE